ncbi:universal stress family protein [Lapidilactobacillus concavus DSM 17758]|uniref:Universal stress family protein n=1 Tax=Lapidilactobacillus concavus DSM 17758 TaxID=1423735 RepID=A0A0R1VQI5_9LACO|nr:universal stress protein [Lapidilactobacillus concavus]KRM08062.1 universal stress family protein [Lapidilactobacillus concavus DSM 17758]GEL12942.1 universal stress protein [Lapidilactobacillus concavus]
MSEQEYKRILVPVDGSPEAELAFTKAKRVAKTNNAHLDILTILDTKQFVGNYGGGLTGDAIYQIAEDAQSYLENLKATTLKHEGFKDDDIDIHVRFGNPKIVISRDFPEDHHNDLIMIGATGLNAIERVLVGSVTEYVNRHALCDVLIVRTDLENEYHKAK